MIDKIGTTDEDVTCGAYEDFPQDEEPSLTFIPHPLPQLTNEPQTLPDSCLSLSLPLLRDLHAQLPPSPHLTLSIGSGTGLVEGLLHSLASPYALNLVSVEIAPSPNRYHASHRTVPGTWALDLLAKEAKAWMFVYPKQVSLVREYMAAFSREGSAETVMYIGPRMDWGDFRGAFEGFAREIEVWGEERMEAAGGRAWECVAIVRPEKAGGSAPNS
ncbi:uncharacterized protein ColSpa_04702 [Colletotrichum spaethianum]|uniref:Uncharacterized protein n=1 Tax=Colletotrichum spaethianum TaxID=700344 RepID=A0AA37L9X2_9PEZI|nr:uncharacterized protein ColSpa_04702 [Colletotrichum spaethianum]GKT44521.1 hypothetical protein ColSpa_04702 [Colletotrichum spaethianum]